MNIWNRVTKGMQPADFTLPNADGNKMLLEYVDGIIMDLLTSNQTFKPNKNLFLILKETERVGIPESSESLYQSDYDEVS
jgi:hypothetical protein